MNIRDVRFNLLLNLNPPDLLHFCMTDQLSYRICLDTHFQQLYLNNHNIDMEIDPNDFLYNLSLFIKIDKAVLDLNDGKTLTFNIPEIVVTIKKSRYLWTVTYKGNNIKTLTRHIINLMDLKDILYELIE